MGRIAKPKDNESLTRLGTFQQIDITQLEYNDGQLKGCPKNPRYIKENEYASLKKSLLSSPEFLEYKPLMVYEYADGKYITICGNMRLKAANELLDGGNEQFSALPCFVLNAETSIAKIKEYAIKDNVQAGSWDWDDLANDDWNVDELQEWGIDCSFLVSSDEDDNVDALFEDAQNSEDKPKEIKLTVHIPEALEEQLQEIKDAISSAIVDYEGVELK